MSRKCHWIETWLSKTDDPWQITNDPAPRIHSSNWLRHSCKSWILLSKPQDLPTGKWNTEPGRLYKGSFAFLIIYFCFHLLKSSPPTNSHHHSAAAALLKVSSGVSDSGSSSPPPSPSSSLPLPPFSSSSSTPRSGELRTQKLKSHQVRTQSLNVLPLKSGVGQYIAIHATLTARNFFLAYVYPSGPFTCIFSKTSPNFFLCWLWLTPDPVKARRIK